MKSMINITIDCSFDEFIKITDNMDKFKIENINVKKRTYCNSSERRKKIVYDLILSCIAGSKNKKLTTKEIYNKKPISNRKYRTYQRYLNEMFLLGKLNKKNVVNRGGNRNYWEINYE